MAEFIDRWEAIGAISKEALNASATCEGLPPEHIKGFGEGLARAQAILRADVPAAETPRPSAEWIIELPMMFGSYKCSACDFAVNINQRFEFKFCPNCGAQIGQEASREM